MGKIKYNIEIESPWGRLNLSDKESWEIINAKHIEVYTIKELSVILSLPTSLIIDRFKKYCLPRISKQESLRRRTEAFKKSFLDKYGVSNPNQVQNIKDKIRQTNLERYGNACTLNSTPVVEKKKQTWLNNYGVDNPSKSFMVKEKKKQTWLNNYGVDNISKHKDNKDKIKKVWQIKYHIESLLTQDYSLEGEYLGKYLRSEQGSYLGWRKYKIKHNICGFIFEKDLNRPPKCPKCYPSKFGYSQNKIYDFIKTHNLEVLFNDRNIIHPYEIDIFLPELNIGFEYNGSYWHNSLFKGQDYHKNKTELALLKGIKLYHIWEHDNENIVKSMVLNKIGISQNKYYARKLKIKKVESKERQIFFDTNHLHGDVKAKLAYGLYLEDELISCISFRSHKEGIEIARFATKLYSQCVGGFQKLLKNSIPELKNLGYSKIITYCDRDWTPDYKDSVYYKNGFKFIKDTGCSLFYSDNRGNKYSRETFQKHKLKQLFPDSYDDNKTANEILAENNILPCHNSGNWKLEFKL